MCIVLLLHLFSGLLYNSLFVEIVLLQATTLSLLQKNMCTFVLHHYLVLRLTYIVQYVIYNH